MVGEKTTLQKETMRKVYRLYQGNLSVAENERTIKMYLNENT